MHTDVPVLALTSYAAFGPMGIGFGMMVAGSTGARRRQLSSSCGRCAGSLPRRACLRLVVGTWRVLVRFILRPVSEEPAYWLRRLFAARR